MGKQIYLVSPSYIFPWLYGESLFGSQGMKRTREIERGRGGGKGRDTVEGKEKREKLKREIDGEEAKTEEKI